MRAWLRRNIWVFVALGVAPLIGAGAGQLNDYVFRILLLAGINITLASSLNLVNGVTGQFSLGHAGFMAVGAYIAAVVTHFISPAAFPLALLLGGLGAAFFGLLVGIPSLRLRGDYLAIATLGFGEIIRVVILNIDVVGGPRGFAEIPPMTNFYWVYGTLVLTLVLLFRLVHSRHGRALLAVREDEIAAEAVGISTTRYKVLAFVVSAFLAGWAGGLYAHLIRYINPNAFTFLKSFEIVTMVVLGGMGSISGSAIAAVFLTILPEALRPLQEITRIDFRMVLYALLLILLMLLRPKGLFNRREVWQLWERKKAA